MADRIFEYGESWLEGNPPFGQVRMATESPLQLSPGVGQRIDFRASIPDEGIRVDNKLSLGVFEIRHHNWYASAETLSLMNKHIESLSPQEPTTKRGEILDEAKSLTNGDRNSQYGEPIDDFTRIADALNALGYKAPHGKVMMPHDVSVIQSVVKLSRITNSPQKNDSWVDLAGYAAVGGEVAEIEGSRDR